MGSNTAVGAFTSIGLRYLLTASISTFTAQQGVFHTLDITISTIAAFLLANQAERNGNNSFEAGLAGRLVGFIAAASIVSLIMGPVNLPLLILASSVSQTAGFIAWGAVSKQSYTLIV